MKFCNLASGSKGNCTYISTGRTSILIDDGITLKCLKERCNSVGIDISTINAIFITHEHDDHIKGIKTLSKSFDIPVYIHPKSLVVAEKRLGGSFCAVENDFSSPIEFEDLAISSFRVSHDAEYTQGFSISDGKKNIVMATDLGYVSDNIYKKLSNADFVYLESNYDQEMLINGPYPYPLKLRINSKNGHLSNDDSSKAIASLIKEGKEHFVLGHLSQHNNTDVLVLQTLKNTLELNDIRINDVEIDLANQDHASKVFEI